MYLVFSHIHVFDENAKRKIIDHLEFLRSSNLLGRFDFIFYHFQIAIGFRAKNEKSQLLSFLFYRWIDFKVNRKIKRYRENFLSNPIDLNNVINNESLLDFKASDSK